MINVFVNKSCNEQEQHMIIKKYQQSLIGLLNHKQFIPFMKIFHGRYILPFNTP